MYQQIKQILLQYGYEEITLNTGDIYLALRQERGEGYAVVTLDEMGGNKLGARQFYHVSEQIREFLQARGCYRCRFLYLLVTEDDSSVGRLFRDYESYWRKCFWRIQPSKGQVMVYEDEDEAFMVLRDLKIYLLHMAPTKIIMKVPVKGIRELVRTDMGSFSLEGFGAELFLGAILSLS